jgi:undecaprenyl phosphate-alpha-L-ara4N flippase subunit ArnE
MALPALKLAGLIITPVIIALGQVLFKQASHSVGEPGLGSLLALARNPYFLVALALYGFGTILWIHVLRGTPLVQAYLFMALSFVLVPALAYAFFGETLGLRHLAGTVLIMAGLVIANS